MLQNGNGIVTNVEVIAKPEPNPAAFIFLTLLAVLTHYKTQPLSHQQLNRAGNGGLCHQEAEAHVQCQEDVQIILCET